jgi:hypothetical protein
LAVGGLLPALRRARARLRCRCGDRHRLIARPAALIAQRGTAAFVELRDELLLGLRHGSGWTSSLWPHPQTRRPTRKLSYLKRVVTPDGRTLVVGASVYQQP